MDDTNTIEPLARDPLGLPYRHLVLTRYNVSLKSARAQSINGLDADWLAHRGKLFRRHCLPSIERQTSSAFEWFVLFHPETPPEHYRFLEHHARVVLARSGSEGFRQIAERWIGRGPVLSTRLDNDDAIAPYFVDRMQQEIASRAESWFRDRRDFIITYPVGVAVDLEHRAGYRYPLGQNSFLGLFEFMDPGREWRSAFHFNHLDAYQRYPVVEIADRDPAWMMMVHDRNVINRRYLPELRESCESIDLDLLAPRFPGLAGLAEARR